MDPTLSSPVPTMVTEFGYCPRTPPTYAPNGTEGGRRVTIVERDASSLPSSPCKSTEVPSSPTRKKSRLFEPLRLLSSRYENVADENGSPKSMKKRKSIANLLSFSSTKSRRPDDNETRPTSPTKKRDVAPSPKKKTLQSTSASRMNRRKSLGDIWGSISGRVSPRRLSISHGRCPDWYEDSGRSTCLNDRNSISNTNSTPKIAANTATTQDVEAFHSRHTTEPPSCEAGSSTDVENYHPESYRGHSISSSLRWYEGSLRSPTQKHEGENEQETSPSSTLINKNEDEPCAVCSPKRNNKEDELMFEVSSIPKNKEKNEPKAACSSIAESKDKRKLVDSPPPVDRKQAKTPDSYLNLLIEGCKERKTPDSFLGELLNAANLDISGQASPFSHYGSNFEENLLSVRNANLLRMKENNGEDDEHVSAPPPYTLNDLSKIELGEITYGAVQPKNQASECPEDHAVCTVREVSEGSSETPSQIDKEFILRGSDRKERYEKLMRKPQPSRRSSDEIIGSRVRLTVAKMTKNFHKTTLSEETCEETPCKVSNLYDFETDQTEVWDSVILGSRTLQEAQTYQPLKSIPSGNRRRLPDVENILQDSIKLRQFPEEKVHVNIENQLELNPSTTTLRSVQRKIHEPCPSKPRQSSTRMVRVEFPKTMNLAAHAELYETKSKAIATLYEYKLGELSNFCTFDPMTNTIFAHALESSVPNPAVLRQAGLEVFWLPMQKVIGQMIQIQEEINYELSNVGRQSLTATVGDGQQESTQMFSTVAELPTSLKPDNLCAHNEAMLAANLYNFDRHGSQFESEKEIIVLRSRSSSLQPTFASPQREEKSSVFDDDFFIDVESDTARGFLGSQYSEESTSSHNNSNHLLPSEMFSSEDANELLWSLDEEDQCPKVGRTWPELARAFLAQQSAQTGRGSEDQNAEPEKDGVQADSCLGEPPAQIFECSKDGQDQDASQISTSGNFGRVLVNEHNAHSGQDSDYDDRGSGSDSAWASQFSTNFLSGESSPTFPYAEHIEDISLPRALSWRSRHSRRAGLSSILAEEDLLKLPKRNQPLGRPSQSKDRSLFASSESSGEIEESCGQVPRLLSLIHTSSPELSEIPFPAREVIEGSSRQTSISYTSYIEAERQRERLYQTFASPVSTKVDNEASEKGDVENCQQIRATTGNDEYRSKLVDLLLRAAETLKLEKQYAPDLRSNIANSGSCSEWVYHKKRPMLFSTSDITSMKGVGLLGGQAARSEAESVENPGNSSNFPPVGSKFTKQKDALVDEDAPKSQALMSELSRSSPISTPTGFRFSKHKKQLLKSEKSKNEFSGSSSSGTDKTTFEHNKDYEKEITAHPNAAENVTPTSSRCPEQAADFDVVIDEELRLSEQSVAKTEHRETSKEDGFHESASEQMHDHTLIKCLASAAEIDQLRTKILKACLAQATALEEHNKSCDTSAPKSGLNSNEGHTSKSEGQKPQQNAGYDELAPERIGEPQNLASTYFDLNQSSGNMFWSRSRPREINFAHSNIRGTGKAIGQESSARQEGRVGALVDIFQARGMMPSMKPALHRKPSPSSSRSRLGDCPTTPSARIVTPSGSVYHPAGTVCIPASRELSRTPIKRVPTPVSPCFRPSSGLSSIDTDMSETFGEILERAEKHLVQYAEVDPYEEI